MARYDVDGKVVQGVDLLKRRHWTWRLDVWPFVILYSIWLFVAVPSLDFTDALIVLGALAVAHILVLLFTAWSVDFRCFVQFSKAKDICSADACKVTPAKFSGSKEIMPLHIRRPTFNLKTPDGGCLAVVLRTGFETSQGKLMRTILFSTERVTANSWESGLFILFLVFFAIIAAGYVLKKGLEDPTRSKYKLFLSCSLIITSVIPPELPMELSIAVNTSLIALARRGIFCTEPFRIPFAGKVDICCFDKTGTLTSDDMEFQGVAGLADNTNLESDTTKLPASTVEVLAACHALVFVDNKLVNEARSLDRDLVESGLTFAGFAVFNCPIRPDSGSVLCELKGSSHDLQELFYFKMTEFNHVVLCPKVLTLLESFKMWVFTENEVEALSDSHDLCIGGDCFEMLQRTEAVLKVIPHIKVFARVAPEQKELILTTFKTVGRMTLMCGDGTNDVGALKQGIALLNAVPPSQTGDSSSETSKPESKSGKLKKPKPMTESSHSAVSPNSSVGPTNNRHLSAAEKQRQKLKKMLDEMNEEGDGRGAPIVKLGDASMASPFTAKHASVAPTLDIIRQGRSTLVTTLQMFKILGLNCLATAYVLSVMYLDGVKLGDIQATISGVFTAAFFLFIAHARPLQTLSAARPHPNIFCAYVLLSLLGQFAIHLFFLISAVNEASKYMPEECIEPDSDFHPNLVNTVSYMVNMMIQVATFAVNYMGHPFNQSISENKPFRENEVEALSDSHDLCIGGDCFEMLQRTEAVLKVIPHIKVFARVAPEQKELILTTFKTVGRMTLMCGDGTNDVGALKQAHVGIALLNAVPPSQTGDSSSETSKPESKSGKLKKPKPMTESSHSAVSPNSSVGPTNNRHLSAAEKQRQKLKKMLDEMNEEGDGRGAPIVKLGDASMASPFTAKHASVAPTLDIIRQGRSTLVTTLQMFKILGLNCLATAYVLSVMYLDGVKLGDIQATISGVFTAAFFLFISHARPLQTLSAARPHPNIFCAYVLLSLLGQFAIHLFFLISAVNEASKYMPEECIEPDSDFHPNLVNTVSYMVNMMIQVATFAVNYMGHPFNQSISENKPFRYALFAAVGFFTVITSDLFRDLNDWLKLEPLPVGMRGKLMLWAALMFLGCYGWERLLRWAFPGKMPAWKRRQKQATAALEKKRL
ncbi:hypothetical protein COCNU_scaffold039443G000040 [Cocos nucifera]|nr:hypothetical protein [Cocos nucifera]